jgi:hypothetical protein
MFVGKRGNGGREKAETKLRSRGRRKVKNDSISLKLITLQSHTLPTR